MRRWILHTAEHLAIKAGYGKGFWILIAGVLLVTMALLEIENHRISPQVERIPASEPLTGITVDN